MGLCSAGSACPVLECSPVPVSPLPLCKERLCKERVKAKGSRYCDYHQKMHYREQPKSRDYAFYNSKRWRKFAKQFLKNNPYCFRCRDAGALRWATVCDHIIPLSEYKNPFEISNLQPLCAECHNTKRQTERKAK